jgi:phenylpyruvate tautomerase PptA (4-oxalocrotonate tautomerase family)
MPYLRLSSLPLDEATKRHLADELTATVLEILPHEKPEWTSVHFTPFDPDDFAVAGRLVADGAIPDTHLEISAPGVDEKSWFALRNRLTDVLIEALTIPDSERWHVNVKLNRYDPHSFAVAGNAADELDRLGEDENDASNARRPAWQRPAVLAGFVAGLVVGYRWLAARVGSDVTVDAAPPVASAPAASTTTTSGPDTIADGRTGVGSTVANGGRSSLGMTDLGDAPTTAIEATPREY